jgi:hypothetical protein
MDLVKYVFYLGVIQIVFSTAWKFIATVCSSLLASAGLHKDWSFLAFKALGYYILVSGAGLVTWDMMATTEPVLSALVGAAGLFIVYTTVAGNLERNRWRAVMNFDRKRVRVMRVDGYLLVGSVLLFLVTLALPEIADHALVRGFRAFIDGVYHTPVLGWIVGLGACFYLLHYMARGLRATGGLVELLLRPGSLQRPETAATPDGDPAEGEYVDFEEVTDADHGRG